MATPDAQDAAAKERIIKHMNADHQASIRRYVEDAKDAWSYQVRDAQMTDITLNDIKIKYGGKEAVIPFDPPMKSLREARERLVQMDKDSLQMLGRSDITVTKYIPPYTNSAHWFNFGSCLMMLVVFSSPSNVNPGSLLYDNVLYRFPPFAGCLQMLQPFVFGILVAAHSYECWVMFKKLKRHGLTPFDGVWWCWIASCFVEGITSLKRVDELIEEKTREKEAKKH